MFTERAAYFLAGKFAAISPWWRFRIWCRIVPGNPYYIGPPSEAKPRAVMPHGFLMDLFESDWMERYALRTGWFYQDEIQALLDGFVADGDTFIDVGANIGFITLAASRLVGTGGFVLAIEPNGELVNRLKSALEKNRITNVRIFETALGSSRGTVRLIRGAHHGLNRISVGDEASGEVELPIEVADELLDDQFQSAGNVFVKIDVEGAELGVLQGMTKLLARPNTRFFVEVGDAHSERFGSTARDVFSLFESYGYKAYRARLGPFTSKIQLKPLSGPLDKNVYDVFFCRDMH